MKEMKLLTKIGARFHAWLEQRRERKAERRSEDLKQEAERVLQVREFGGNLYVCFNDIPLMPDNLLNAGLALAVEEIRDIYIKYRKSNEVWHRK